MSKADYNRVWRDRLKADAAQGPANHPEMVPLSLIIGGGEPAGEVLTIRCDAGKALSDEDFAAAFGLEFRGDVW